jgi:excisionase family DNA binding protein
MDRPENQQSCVTADNRSLQNQQRMLNNDQLWTVEDVAQYLQLQPETIRSMARRGELPALKIGKVWRFQKLAIYNMIIKLG